MSFYSTSGRITADVPDKSDSREWFAVYTRSCQEKRVTQHLFARDIEFFLPVYRKVSRWKNGQRVAIDTPLFPGYVFVHFERNKKVRVLELPGVHSIVGFGYEPIPLPRNEIEALRQGIPLLNAEPHPYLDVGDKVKVRRGPLEGMTGFVLRRKNGCRLVISLELIMKSVSVEVSGQDLDSIEQRCQFEISPHGPHRRTENPAAFPGSFQTAGSEAL